MKYKVGVIGRFGFGKTLLNGQVIKTKSVVSAIADALGEENILQVDTYGGIKALLRLPFQCFGALTRCRNLLIMPAHKGIRVVAPLLAVMNLLFRRKLHYVVIGGWLNEMIKGKPFLTWCLKRFDWIYVETASLKAGLQERGFSNAVVMPNCKDLPVLDESQLVYVKEEPYPLCTFSRVIKEKGITDAVEAVCYANKQLGKTAYSLDIYGQIDDRQAAWFEQLEDSFPDFVHYSGAVPFDKSVETLKRYFALLFPTYYDGEGFAGTIIDAFSAGVPVIASSWKYNAEIVSEEITGALVPPRDPQALAAKLLEIHDCPEKWNSMKEKCLNQAHSYSPKIVFETLLSRLA